MSAGFAGFLFFVGAFIACAGAFACSYFGENGWPVLNINLFPAPKPVPYYDAVCGRWRDGSSHRFCKAPAWGVGR